MASYIYPIPEVYRSVTRPISITIIRQLLDISGLKPEEFRKKMVGFAEAESVPGSTIDTDDVDKTPNRLLTDGHFTLEVQEEVIGDLVTPVRYSDNLPIFRDDDLRITLKPVLAHVKTTLSVVYHVKDRVTAHNWLQTIKRRIYQVQLNNMHSVDYHYPLPKEVTQRLMVFHELREKVDGLDENFGEWLNRCMVNRWTVLTNLAGKEKQLAIQEKQVNILGSFDFDFEPSKPEKNDDKAGGWQIQFDYIFWYQRPDNVVLEYPLVVHNQLLPLPLIQTTRPEHRSTFNTYMNKTDEAFEHVALSQNRWGAVEPEGIPEPIFDDWLAPHPPKHYYQLGRTLITVNPADRKDVIDVKDFSSSYSFKETILDYLKQDPSSMLVHYDNIFYIDVCRWDRRLPHDEFEINNELMVRTKEDMNLKDMWHVVIYILYNPIYLSDKGWQPFLANCQLAKEWISAVLGKSMADKIRCNLDGTTDKDSITQLVNELKKYTGTGSNNPTGPLKPTLPYTGELYVGDYIIKSRRLQDA